MAKAITLPGRVGTQNVTKLRCLFVAMALMIGTPGWAQNVGPASAEVRAGELLLRRHCARCHAVGPKSESPHPTAPPFRNISRKYPVEHLAEALAEGILVAHPDMPTFYFEADEVNAIIRYLNSIQIR